MLKNANGTPATERVAQLICKLSEIMRDVDKPVGPGAFYLLPYLFENTYEDVIFDKIQKLGETLAISFNSEDHELLRDKILEEFHIDMRNRVAESSIKSIVMSTSEEAVDMIEKNAKIIATAYKMIDIDETIIEQTERV